MQVIFSGGGFSNYFAMPSYQKSAVKEYLTRFPPPYTSDTYNTSGTSRAFPDLSANGWVLYYSRLLLLWSLNLCEYSANYVIAVDGEFELVFGTSASSPVTGAILTAVNDARLAIGKGPIGFINPAVSAFHYSSSYHFR